MEKAFVWSHKASKWQSYGPSRRQGLGANTTPTFYRERAAHTRPFSRRERASRNPCYVVYSNHYVTSKHYEVIFRTANTKQMWTVLGAKRQLLEMFPIWY